MVKAKIKTKMIKVPSRSTKKFVKVPRHWLGKWVAVNNNHAMSLYGSVDICLTEYVITHRRTGYAIGPVYRDAPLWEVKARAEKLDALGGECWNFSQVRTVKTKRWKSKYMSTVFDILGRGNSHEN